MTTTMKAGVLAAIWFLFFRKKSVVWQMNGPVLIGAPAAGAGETSVNFQITEPGFEDQTIGGNCADCGNNPDLCSCWPPT